MGAELGAALPCPRLLILGHPLLSLPRVSRLLSLVGLLLLPLLEDSEGENGLEVPSPGCRMPLVVRSRDARCSAVGVMAFANREPQSSLLPSPDMLKINQKGKNSKTLNSEIC